MSKLKGSLWSFSALVFIIPKMFMQTLEDYCKGQMREMQNCLYPEYVKG